MCEFADSRAGQKIHDCDCYRDRIIIETLDEGYELVPGGRDETGKIYEVLSPGIEQVDLSTDVHTCMDQSLLPARAWAKGMEMTGMWIGEQKKKLAQCLADGIMAAQKAKPARNIRAFDAYRGLVLQECSNKIPRTP
jgi:hypothetical protein